MFGKKKSELDLAIEYFEKNNETYYANGSSFGLAYYTLIESRISNDLLLISNQQLCLDLGVDIGVLATELRELIALRQRISLSAEAEKKKEQVERSK